MRVQIQQLRHNGVLIRQKDLLASPRHFGLLRVREFRDPEQSRPVVQARLLDANSGTECDVLPELNDARLMYVEDGELRLIGTQRREDCEFAQVWAVEQAPC